MASEGGIFESVVNAMTVLAAYPWWARSIAGAVVGALLLGVGPSFLAKAKDEAKPSVQNNSATALGSTVFQTNNYYGSSAATQASAKPGVQNVSTAPLVSSEFVLAWVDVGRGQYQLGAMLQLGSGDGKSHLVTRIKFDIRTARLLEGDVKNNRYAQSDSVADDIQSLSVPSSGPSFARLFLPIKVGLDAAGKLPEDVLLEGDWSVYIDGTPLLIMPSRYKLLAQRFGQTEWRTFGTTTIDLTLYPSGPSHAVK